MSEGSEHDLIRNGAALVAHADRGLVRVTGSERAAWLQGLLTNDVEALAPGQGCYAAWLTPQGRMITDAHVLVDDDALTMEVPAPLGEQIHRQLDQAIFAEDVHLVDETGRWRTLGVHGATAALAVARAASGSKPALARLTAEALDAWKEYEHAPLGHLGRVTRTFVYGVPGFLLRVLADDADLWMSRLRLAGATFTSAAALDFARIEAGRPEFLIDMDADTIPLEAGIESRAISFTKGCYVGQEVIVRVVHRGGGRVARKLVGLTLECDSAPPARAAVKSERGEIGRITSAAWSPRLETMVAMAYVHRDFVAAGTPVAVACSGADVAAVVQPFPIP